MNKEVKKEVKQLLKKKDYDKIFDSYGRTIYKISVPKKYQRKDIKKLLEDGRFFDVYRKYGYVIYKQHLDQMRKRDVEYETGSTTKGILHKIKLNILYRVFPYLLSATGPIGVATYGEETQKLVKKNINRVKYAKEIDEYNKKIEEYAEKINSMNLTDLQIFMKVIYDMIQEIRGYAHPEKEVFGYKRLSLDLEGIGVCRNFADDITAKLNEINPAYNARNVIVWLDIADYDNYKFPDMQVKILESENQGVSFGAQENIRQEKGATSRSLVYNHEVTAVDVNVNGKNVTLILDSTNPGIGIYKDKQIYLLNSSTGEGQELCGLGQFLAEGPASYAKMYITNENGFYECEYSIEEMKKIFGVEEQNKAIEYIKSLNQNKVANKKDNIVEKVKINEQEVIEKINTQDANTKNDNFKER